MKDDVGFDRVGGRLRLTRGLLVEMCALEAGAEASSIDALRDAGLLEAGRLHPKLVPLAETAARPLCRLTLDVSAKTSLHLDGWIGARFALLLAGPTAATSVFDATFLSRSLLTAQLARSVGLGPRPRAKVIEAVEIDQGLLEALLGSGEPFTASQLERLVEPSEEVLPAWLEVLSDVSARMKARWRLGVWWNSFEESPEARSLEMIDSEIGLFYVSHAGRGGRKYPRVRLRPLTPSQVWRLLCALLPGPEEVAEPLGL